MKIKLNKKIFIISVIFTMFIFFGINKVSAWQTYSANGQNGLVWTTVDIVPNSILPVSSTGFQTKAYMQVVTPPETVKLTALNNNGPETEIISQRVINNTLPTSEFTVPLNHNGIPGTYPIEFKTWVDLNLPPIVYLNVDIKLYAGVEYEKLCYSYIAYPFYASIDILFEGITQVGNINCGTTIPAGGTQNGSYWEGAGHFLELPIVQNMCLYDPFEIFTRPPGVNLCS